MQYKGYLHALFILDIIRTCILRYKYVNPDPILPKNLLYDDERKYERAYKSDHCR